MKIPIVCLLLCLLTGCREAPQSVALPLFTRVPAQTSGLTFANRITEDDTFNILDFEYVYNGGGVGAADFNGDGLTDLYFTGNTTSNRLYLNRGDFQFEDVTERAGVAAEERWCGGVNIADINADGRPDLYVSATIRTPGSRRQNLLYLNEGSDADGIPRFREVAAICGIADTSHTTQSAFLDYDLDGDLDLYLLVNEMDNRAIPNRYLPKIIDGTGRKNDKLYRNDGPGPDGLPRFTEVTRQAGILKEGFGLGLSVCDPNQDGWPDLYVTNDYLSNDLLWINNQDGTFTDQASDYLKHTSYSAMGNDVADLNGDGLDDLVAVDMFPENNLRRKAMMPPNSYTSYLNNARFDYLPQFTRNTLQLNRRRADGSHAFRDVGMQAGIAATDWSWSPLAADVDNDGDRDLLITNGFPRDITDRDFMDYDVVVSRVASRELRMERIPSVKIANYAYENDGGQLPHFTNRTQTWGFDTPSFSNGAAYVDLDNDGDLDYVVNNINDSCTLLRNELIQSVVDSTTHYLRLRLQQPGQNPAALGARVVVHSGDRMQTAFNQPVRGFLSTVSDVLHFGLGASETTDSTVEVTVYWPGGEALAYRVLPDRTTVLRREDGQAAMPLDSVTRRPLLVATTETTLPQLEAHQDKLYIDFNVQPLLPHQLSEFGPGLAVADVNGDGLEDIYRTGASGHPGVLLLQQPDGVFRTASGLPKAEEAVRELGSLFFDADGDGDQDLYLVSGGSQPGPDAPTLQDRLLLNDGRGNFTLATAALPPIRSSGSCVRATDVDRDGDLDLFVGGRLTPGRFPEPTDSYLLLNDGGGTFTDGSPESFTGIGLVCDALWTDYDGDGWVDLLVAGQGMPLRLFNNRAGTLVEADSEDLDERIGWWNSLQGTDIDQDGDIDYVAGNLGMNNLYTAGNEEGYVVLYGADFDGNGGYDLLVGDLALNEQGQYVEFPHYQRINTEKQLISVKQRYPRHESFGRVTMDTLLAGYHPPQVTALRANYLRSAWIENLGGGRFAFHPLPGWAQAAPLFGLQLLDVNADGYDDLVAVGNYYGTEPGMGPLDALDGLVLLYDPARHDFALASSDEQGIDVPGDGRSLTVVDVRGSPVIIAAEYQGPTRSYRLHYPAGTPLPAPGAGTQRLSYSLDGRTVAREVYQGSGYLTQSSRTVWLPEGAQNVRWTTPEAATK